jgi:hypothetical protein
MKEMESRGQRTGTNLGAIKNGVWQDGYAFDLHTMQFVEVSKISV